MIDQLPATLQKLSNAELDELSSPYQRDTASGQPPNL